MNGRQARGWGISAHERMNTTTKNAANSIVGKLTAGILAAAAVLPAPAVALQTSLLAEAVQGCLVGVGPSGIPAPRNPDVRVPRAERPAAAPAVLPAAAAPDAPAALSPAGPRPGAAALHAAGTG